MAGRQDGSGALIAGALEHWACIVLRPPGQGDHACIAASNPVGAGLNWHPLTAWELVVASGGSPPREAAGVARARRRWR